MAEATKALNQKLEVPQSAEFNPECSGSDKTMAVTASIEAAAAAATALSSSSSNGLNGIRTWYPRNNKGLGSKFQSSRVRDKPEEGRRIRRPKRCGKNNLDEEVSPKSIINENTSSQKYRQLLPSLFIVILYIAKYIDLQTGLFQHDIFFSLSTYFLLYVCSTLPLIHNSCCFFYAICSEEEF